jgi:hypothetical protein
MDSSYDHLDRPSVTFLWLSAGTICLTPFFQVLHHSPSTLEPKTSCGVEAPSLVITGEMPLSWVYVQHRSGRRILNIIRESVEQLQEHW